MIELYNLEGEQFELASDEVTIELNNSLFNDGLSFKGSLSYPINLAFTAKNKRLLGFCDQLEVFFKTANMPVQVRFGSKAFKKCKLHIGVSEHCFVGSLKLDIGSISDRIREVRLTEIPFKSFSLGTIPTEISSNMLTAAANTNWRNIPYTFIPTKNDDFLKNISASSKEKEKAEPEAQTPPLINSFLSSSFYFQDALCTPIVPYFYLPYILNQIAEWLGLTLKGDFSVHPDVEKIVLYNINGAVQNPDVKLTANKHLPDLLISDFFKALSSFFCCRIKVDDRQQFLDISWKKTVFETPIYRNWREKVVKVIDQRFCVDDGYTLSSQKAGGEQNANQNPKDEVIVGAGKTKIEAKSGTLEFTRELMLYSKTEFWDIPMDKRAGNLPIQPNSTNSSSQAKHSGFPLCFLFTQGIDGLSGKYPKASIEGSSFSLKISGNKGLYSYAHKAWLKRTFAARTLKASVLLNENDLHNLQDENIILIKSKSGVCVHCLIKKLTFTSFRHQTGVLTEVEMIVLDSERP